MIFPSGEKEISFGRCLALDHKCLKPPKLVEVNCPCDQLEGERVNQLIFKHHPAKKATLKTCSLEDVSFLFKGIDIFFVGELTLFVFFAESLRPYNPKWQKKSTILGGLLRIGFFNTQKKSLKKSKRRRLWTPRRRWILWTLPRMFFFCTPGMTNDLHPQGWLMTNDVSHMLSVATSVSGSQKKTIEAPGFTGKNRATSEEAIWGRRFLERRKSLYTFVVHLLSVLSPFELKRK